MTRESVGWRVEGAFKIGHGQAEFLGLDHTQTPLPSTISHLGTVGEKLADCTTHTLPTLHFPTTTHTLMSRAHTHVPRPNHKTPPQAHNNPLPLHEPHTHMHVLDLTFRAEPCLIHSHTRCDASCDLSVVMNRKVRVDPPSLPQPVLTEWEWWERCG